MTLYIIYISIGYIIYNLCFIDRIVIDFTKYWNRFVLYVQYLLSDTLNGCIVSLYMLTELINNKSDLRNL